MIFIKQQKISIGGVMSAKCAIAARESAASVKDYIRKNFGIMTGSETFEVCLRFSPAISPWLAEQVWHPAQQIRWQDDKTLCLSFPVADFREVKREILKYGAEVEVVTPASLREEVKREIIDEINHYLQTDEIVVLHGARQVGKTSIMLYLQEQLKREGIPTFFMDLEDSRLVRILDGGIGEFRKHLREEGLLNDAAQNKVTVFIDEIQYLANPSEFLKLTADHHKDIKLIVSGSSSFAIKRKFKDSLAGRTVDFEIFNLSFSEFLTFRDIPVAGDALTEKKTAELKRLFKEYALYGGYPKIVLTSEVFRKEKYLQQIIDTYIKMDIRDLANIREPDKFSKLLETLASQSGKILNVSELANTTRITQPTIERYLFILENTFILKLVRPYSSNLRSELFKQPKIFFYDSGLAQVLWLKGLQKELLGSVFETAFFAELVKKYSPNSVFYWRTKDKKEIDFILKTKDKFLPVEVKINFAQFNPTAIKYFNRHYGLDDYRLIAMEGAPKNEKEIYPWGL